MKIAAIIARVLLGLLYVFSAVVGLFHLVKGPELTGNAKAFMEGMVASGYLMPLLMFTQLLCGLALVAGRFVALATVMIFPVTLNIALYHIFVATEGMVMGIIMLGVNLFIAYAHRKHYVTLVAAKSSL